MPFSDVQALAAQIETLPLLDQEALYGRLGPWMQRWHTFTSSPAALQEVREQRFARGIVCPHCQAAKCRRHGTFTDKKGYVKQRFRCGECRRTFSDLSDTPMARSRRQALWGKFMSCLIDGLSCRKAAEVLGVNHKTTFRWRHKVMDAIKSLERPQLAGIVESDETYFRHSFKGQRRLREAAGRPARERGEAATKRGLSREQVCVVVARDREKQTIAETAGFGVPTTRAVQEVLTPVTERASVLCTDGGSHFKRYAKARGIDHRPIKGGKRTVGSLYHIQNVNAYHSRLKDWIRRFKGVSTKYLPNYMIWYVFLDKSRKMSGIAARKQLLLESCSASSRANGGTECPELVTRPGT